MLNLGPRTSSTRSRARLVCQTLGVQLLDRDGECEVARGLARLGPAAQGEVDLGQRRAAERVGGQRLRPATQHRGLLRGREVALDLGLQGLGLVALRSPAQRDAGCARSTRAGWLGRVWEGGQRLPFRRADARRTGWVREGSALLLRRARAGRTGDAVGGKQSTTPRRPRRKPTGFAKMHPSHVRSSGRCLPALALDEGRSRAPRTRADVKYTLDISCHLHIGSGRSGVIHLDPSPLPARPRPSPARVPDPELRG